MSARSGDVRTERPKLAAKTRANAWMALIALTAVALWHVTVVVTSDGVGVLDVAITLGGLLRAVLGLLPGAGSGSPLDLGPGTRTASVATVVTVWLLLLGALLGGAVALVMWRHRRLVARRGQDGLAGAQALRNRLQGPKGLAAGVQLAPFAIYGGKPMRARAEDTGVMIAPPRQGKSAYLAVGQVVDAPAAVVATSTKVELVRTCAHARSRRGRVWVFDPEGVSLWPERTHWDLVAGCQAVKVARDRADAMVAARPLDGGGRNVFFTEAASTVLRCLLHAAALGDFTMREVLRWARNFDDDTPYNILGKHPDAAPGWLEDLRKFCRGDARETVSSTDMSLSLVLGSLADPAVVAMVCPPPETDEGAVVFDPATFVTSTDALFLLSEGGKSGAAPLLTALVEAVVRAGKTASQHLASGRLDPPVTFVLDEVANVAPIPELPALMSDGGGRGLAVWAFAQDYAQLENRYGSEGARTIWSAASIKMLLGGSANDTFLESVSRLIGDQHVRRSSQQYTDAADLPNYSLSTERERKLSVSDLRELAEGNALLLYRDQPGAVVDLVPWWKRKDAAALREGQQWALTREGIA